MSKIEKIVMTLTMFISLAFGASQSISAMHITEGYLPIGYSIMWGAICLPFLAWGVIKIRRIAREHPKTLILLAMAGAYAFVLSALKIPSVSGSSSHPTGTGLGAMLFGPAVMAVLGIIVLLFQALLLAHGGITTLGANTFSMAIAGPFLCYGIYMFCKKIKLNKSFSIFLAAALGDLFTYCITSVQLGIAHPGSGGIFASTTQFLGIFAPTQIPLAIIEGILTVVVVMGLETYAKPELREIGFIRAKHAKEAI